MLGEGLLLEKAEEGSQKAGQLLTWGWLGRTPGIGVVRRPLRTKPELWQNEGQKVKSLGSHSCIMFSPALRPLGTWSLSNSLPNGFITRCFLLCARIPLSPWTRGKAHLCWQRAIEIFRHGGKERAAPVQMQSFQAASISGHVYFWKGGRRALQRQMPVTASGQWEAGWAKVNPEEDGPCWPGTGKLISTLRCAGATELQLLGEVSGYCPIFQIVWFFCKKPKMWILSEIFTSLNIGS